MTPLEALREIERIHSRLSDPEFGAEAHEEANELMRSLLHDGVDWATDGMFRGLHSVALMRANRAKREREALEVN